MAEPILLARTLRWSTLLLAAMPLLGMRPMVAAIALWLVLLVAQAIVRRPRVSVRSWRWGLLLSAPFLLMLIDLLRADALVPAWHIVERSAALVLFPAGFLLLSAPADERLRTSTIDVFSCSALALFLYVNGRLLLSPELLYQHPQALFSDRYRAAFGDLSGMHPPFAAYHFVCAALFQVLAAMKGGAFRWPRAGAALLLLTGAGLIGSRMPLIAFAVAMVPAVMMAVPRREARRGALLAIAAVVLVAVAIPSTRERIAKAMHSGAMPTAGTLNDVNIRRPIAECSLELLERHWIAGMGQDRVQPALDRCYEQFGLPQLLNGSYSTHCQPLHWWIAFGLAGLAAFLVLFGAPMREAVRLADGEALGFLVIIVLCCLTENVLARQWGVVLFAYFNTLFLAGRKAG